MQTIEVLFVNRRKEKITADAVSFTDAPGWIVVKTDGSVVEMIPANVVKRLKFLPSEIRESAAAPVPQVNPQTALQPHMLSLPSRREVMEQRRHFSPLISQRR